MRNQVGKVQSTIRVKTVYAGPICYLIDAAKRFSRPRYMVIRSGNSQHVIIFRLRRLEAAEDSISSSIASTQTGAHNRQ